MKDFFDAYNVIDPEPSLVWVEGQEGQHYTWYSTVEHALWHRRMTDYWMRNFVGEVSASVSENH